MAVYDIELKPKIVDDGQLKKLQAQIDAISSKKVDINLGVKLRSKTTPEEFGAMVKAAKQIKNVDSADKNISLTIDTTQAGKSLDDIFTKLEAIRAVAEKNIALNLSINHTGETNPENIKQIIEAAKEISTLRSGNKNITLAVDIGKVGEQVEQALNLIRDKVANNVPMVTSNIGVNSDGIAKELDNAANKAATFNLDVNTSINTQSLQSLLDQVDRIAALTPDDMTKIVTLKVNVDSFVKEVQEALAILNSINPELMSSSQAINNRFDKYYCQYTKQAEEYQKIVEKARSEVPEFESPGYSDWFKQADKKAKELLNTVQLINNLVANNNFLYDTRPQAWDFSTVEEQIKDFEGFKKEAFGYFSSGLEEGTQELEETKKKFEQLFNFSTGTSTLTDGVDDLTDGVKGTTKSVQTSLDIINKIDSVTKSILARVKTMEETFEPLVETVRKLSNAIGTLNTNMGTTQENSFTPMSDNINQVLQNIKETNNSLGTMATNVKTIADSISKITSPFDVGQFANTSKMLDDVERKYKEIIDTYSETKLKLTVETNAGETLDNAKKNVEAMISAQQVFEKWLGKYQKKHPSDEGAVANAAGSQAVVQALSEYNNLLSEGGKEVPLTFTQTGLFEILEAYKELVDKIVRVEFELTNYDTVQNAINEIGEAGAINKSGASTTPPLGFTLDPEALTEIKSRIGDVVSKLDSIISVLPASKEQAAQTDSLDLSKIEEMLKGISGAISQSSETKSEPVTKGFVRGIYTEMRGYIQRIVSLLETIDAKFETRSETNNKQGKDTVTNSLLDGILKSLDQSSVYVNSIDGNLKKLSTPKKSKESTKNSDANKIIKAITDLQGLVKQKTDKLPDRLVSISKTNSSISTNTRNTQSNTGTASRNIGSMYKSLGSKADKMLSQLSAINTKLQQGATIGANNPDSLNNTNADNLTKALNGLASILTMQQSQDGEERKRRGLLPIAGMIPNVTQQTNLQTQSNDRIKEYENILKFIGNRNLDSVFGSKNKIETYINALKTLNNEIANATKTLNANDATKAQRKEAQERIANSSKSLQAILNGNNALGIDPDKIANIKQLLATLNTLNTSIGNVDQALPNIEKLQSALKTYDVSIDPINNAVKGLTDVRRKLGNMMTELSSENLDADMIESVQTRLTQTQNEINTLLTQSNQILDTNNADSFKSVSKGFLEAESEIKKYKSQVEGLKKLLQDLKDKKINLSTIDMGNGRSAKDMETFITQYENFLNTSKNVATPADMQTFAANFQANYQIPLRQYIQGLTEARHQFAQLQQAAKENSDPRSIAKSVEDLTARMIKWKQANNQAFKIDDYARQYNKIFTELTSGTISSREVVKKLQTDFAHLNRQVVQAGYNTKNFTTKLKEMFKKYGGWTLVTKTMNIAMRLIRSMVTQVKELDTSMTNLRKVTEATGDQLNTFLESAGKRSVALGASLTDYIDAVSEFSRLGKSLDEAQKLGELATTYKTVAEDLDIKTASQSIISTMQAFSGIGVQAEEIVDKFNYVGNNFAASSAQIGESLQRSAAALSGASNSLSESIALSVAGNEIVQNAETIGTSLKTISARIRGTTSELGDDADDLTVTTSKLRKEIKALTDVDILDKGAYKSTYQILKEIAEVYDTLDSGSQARIADLLGGKVGMNTIQAILQNFETAKKIVEELDTGLAEGSATKELERSLDSIQGKLNQLKSSWQQLSTDFLGTDVIKGAVDLLKGLVSTLDKLTKSAKGFGLAITTAMTGLIANRAVGKSSIGGSILGITNKRLDFMTGIQPEALPNYSLTESAINTVKQAKINGDDLDSLTQLSAEMREYAKNTEVANMSVSNFYATQMKSAQGFLGSVQAIKTYNNKIASMEQRMAIADAVAISNKQLGEQMKQLNGAEASAAMYFSTLKTGLKEFAGNILGAVKNGLVSFIASLAIGALVRGIQWLTESYERMLKKNAELAKSFKETSDALQENSDNINSLMSQYANIIVATSDLSTAQSQLIDIQKELVESLGMEEDQLDLVSGSYAENIKLIQERRKALADEFTGDSKNIDQYEKAKKYLTETSKVYTGTTSTGAGGSAHTKGKNITEIVASGIGDWSSAGNVISELEREYGNIAKSLYNNTLYIGGTVEEQIETLKALHTALTEKWKDKPLSANERDWLAEIQNTIDTLENQKKSAEELIKKFEELKSVGDISDKTYSQISKVEDVVKGLQTAENAKEIIGLSNSYRQLKDEIYSAVPEDDTVARDMLDTYFETIEKTIDKHLLEINNETTVLGNVYKKFQDETYDKFTTKLSKLDSAIKSLSAGDYLDDSAMNELIKMDELALEDFQKTADGYTISLSNLLKLREKLIDEQKEDITDTLDEEKKLYANQLAQVEQLEKEYEEKKDDKTKNDLAALKKQADETNKRIKAYQSWYEMVSENIQALQEEIYEKISSKVSKVDSAVKSLSAGEYLDAATLAELVKVDSSLVGQFQKSIEGYTISIGTLYNTRKKLIENQRQDIEQAIAYNKKEIEEQNSIIEIYKRMVYDKTGQLLSDQARRDAISQANESKKKAEEDLKYWELQRELINQNIDAISIFKQSLSDVKGFKDDITSLYSDDGIDDQFFIDHPELLQYRNDISKLAEEIQKLAKTKASPVIEQLRAAMNESISNGDFDGARKYNAMIEQLNQATDLSNLNMLEKQKKKIREQVEEKERYIKKLERQKDKEQKILDKLNKQKEVLEKQEEKYQTASKTAQDYIDELIDTLEEETDALEENKKAIEEDFDARIQAIKDMMDAIDKETDAIDKEAEAQERLNDLKEKELALEKARNTKVRVYTAERGWQIMADSEAVAAAQKDYDKALADYNKWKRKEEDDARKAELQAQIDALEKEKETALASVDAQIEAIEAQKKEFEEYKQLWEDALNAYQKLQDGMTAAAILGSDWREKVSQKDAEILNTFAENYNKIEQELHGVVEKRIEQIDKTIEKYDEQINKQNDLKSAQETYLSYYETYSKSFVDLTDAQTAALERLKKALDLGDSETALEAIIDADKAFGEGKNKNETKLSSRFKLTDMYTRLMQTAPTALVDGIKSTFDSLKNLPNNLKSVMSSVNNSTNVSNDNRTQTINVNNPALAMTEAAFMSMLTGAFVKLNQESQIGKK